MRTWCHQNEQLCEVRPSFTSERTFGWNVNDVLRGVDTFDLDSRIQVYPVKQPIQIHTMSLGDVFHGRAPAFDGHLDHRIITFKNTQRRSFGWKCASLKEHHQYCLSPSCPP